MAKLSKEEKEKIAANFKGLTKDEQDAIREALGIPEGEGDLRATIEQLQKDIVELRGKKPEGEKTILQRLFGD